MNHIDDFFNAVQRRQSADRAEREAFLGRMGDLNNAVNRTMMIRLVEQQQQIKQLEALAREAVELAQQRTKEVVDLTRTIEAMTLEQDNGGPEVRAVLEQALVALVAAQKHHFTTSLPEAIRTYGSREGAAAAGLETWRNLVPGAIKALHDALDEPKKG